MASRRRSEGFWRDRLALVGSLSLGLGLALFSLDCRVLIPRQGWDQSWGPLVPHDSFPGDCQLCHVPDRWDLLREDFAFDHDKETGFALKGAHAGAACLRCHNDRGPVRVYVARGCGGCHADPHSATQGLDCSRCHDEISWRARGLVAEHARTGFPLVGVHIATPCESCHERAAVGQFRGAPSACEVCHRGDLAQALSPDHIALGWVQDCERCHIPRAWSRGSFVHSMFPLSGGHAGLDCEACHVRGQFAGTPRDCYSCHQQQYESAPNHVAQSFSTQCQICHNVNTWENAVFNHRFPLVGNHNVDCTVCHVGGDTSTFTCLQCHGQNETGNQHDEVSGYSYNSQACYNCHPNGRH